MLLNSAVQHCRTALREHRARAAPPGTDLHSTAAPEPAAQRDTAVGTDPGQDGSAVRSSACSRQRVWDGHSTASTVAARRELEQKRALHKDGHKFQCVYNRRLTRRVY